VKIERITLDEAAAWLEAREYKPTAGVPVRVMMMRWAHARAFKVTEGPLTAVVGFAAQGDATVVCFVQKDGPGSAIDMLRRASKDGNPFGVTTQLVATTQPEALADAITRNTQATSGCSTPGMHSLQWERAQ
jgi:hypothetical protein